MAHGRQEEDRNDVVSFRPLTKETTTRTTAPLPTLPFDLLHEILCRLPVKLLEQLRCLCKSFNTLITDPKFAKKHLCLSTKQHRLVLCSRDFLLYDSPIPSVLSTSTITLTQLNYPVTRKIDGYIKPFRLSTCDGILCFAIDHISAILWNPSIGKFRLLPPLENPKKRELFPFSLYSFGHDPFIDNYKIIGISFCINHIEVSVNTIGTNYWRRIQDFPCSNWNLIPRPGVFVSGTVNFLKYKDISCISRAIVSLDLEKESYQNLTQPELEKGKRIWQLGRMRDCLCIFVGGNMSIDVLIMTEYGNKESWNKLYHVPCMIMIELRFCAYKNALYILQDDQLLMDCNNWHGDILKFFVYDSKNGASNIHEIQETNHQMKSEVYIESLISPCYIRTRLTSLSTSMCLQVMEFSNIRSQICQKSIFLIQPRATSRSF